MVKYTFKNMFSTADTRRKKGEGFSSQNNIIHMGQEINKQTEV